MVVTEFMASSSSAYSVAAATYGRRKRSVMTAILMWTLMGMLMMNLALINITPVNAAAKKESSSPGAAALTHDFYSQSCPKLHNIVRTVVKKAVARDPRMAASLLRLEFHDCFVNVRNVLPLLHSLPACVLLQAQVPQLCTSCSAHVQGF
jgi:hypothetical protein